REKLEMLHPDQPGETLRELGRASAVAEQSARSRAVRPKRVDRLGGCSANRRMTRQSEVVLRAEVEELRAFPVGRDDARPRTRGRAEPPHERPDARLTPGLDPLVVRQGALEGVRPLGPREVGQAAFESLTPLF